MGDVLRVGAGAWALGATIALVMGCSALDDEAEGPGVRRPSTDCTEAANWPDEWASSEEAVLTLVNQHRAAGATCGGQAYGPASALVMESRHRCAARLHSLDMADREYFSHVDPEGVGMCQRISRTGYEWSSIAENIAIARSPEDVVRNWMESEGHCANIMNPNLVDTGIGYATGPGGNLWTQTFGAPGRGDEGSCRR
jgi:uncharacterized protein YkwD